MCQRQEQITDTTFSQAPAASLEEASAAPASVTPATWEQIITPWHQIEPLLRRLRRDPLMQQIKAVSRGEDYQQPALISPLIEILQDHSEHRWRERTVAAWALGWLPLDPEQTMTVAGLLCAILENRQTSAAERLLKRTFRAAGRAFLWALACGTPLAFMLSFFRSLGVSDLSSALNGVLLVTESILLILGVVLGMLFLASPLILLFSFLLDADRIAGLCAMAATTLGCLRVPESVGALAKATLDSNSDVQQAAVKALCAVVPTLTPEHYGQLDSEAVPNLCHALEYEWDDYHVPASLAQSAQNPRIVEALLEALGKVGDGRAVPYVQRLATSSRPAHLKTAAAQILPILQERQRQENERGMLVRSACMPVAAPEQLLRSASANPQSPAPELLLRPSLPSSPGTQQAASDIQPSQVLHNSVSGEQA